MKYGDVLGRAFRALGKGGLWLFTLSAVLASAAPFAIVGAILFLGLGPGGLLNTFPDLAAVLPTSALASAVLLFATLAIGGLFVWPIAAITAGGYIHLSDEAIAGRPVRVGEGWSFGLRRFWRTLGIQVVLGLAMTVAVMVATAPFVGGIVWASTGPDSSAGPRLVVSICCGYLYLLLALLAVVFIFSSWIQLSLRYGLIGGRTMDDAMGSGWKAFRAAWKQVLLFFVILIGVAWGYAFASSLITTPLTFFAMPPSMWLPGARPTSTDISSYITRSLVLLPVRVVVNVPLSLFTILAWTAFFRRLTGLDADPAPMPVAPTSGEWTPQAQQPPAI